MVARCFELTPAQVARLSKRAVPKGVSRSAVVRAALEVFFKTYGDGADGAAVS
jgi:hypothetical protein